MGRKAYDVVLNGIPTRVLLSDDEAKRRGLFAEPKQDEEPKKAVRKSRKPANKQADPEDKGA